MFIATVSKVANGKIYVTSPLYGSITEVTGPSMTFALNPGDKVLCDILNNRRDNLVILGKIVENVSEIVPVDYLYAKAFRYSSTGQVSTVAPGDGEVTNDLAPLETAGRSAYPAGSSIMRVDGTSYWPSFPNGGTVHTHQYYYRTHQLFFLYSQTEPLIYQRQWWNSSGQWSPWVTYQKKFGDGVSVPTGSTTGTTLGGASDKVGFFGTTPATKQSSTTDLGTAMSNLGLRSPGTAYPITTSGNVSLTGVSTVNDLRQASSIKTADYTATASDTYIRMDSPNNRTVTLPSPASTSGKRIVVQKGGNTTGSVTVSGTIDSNSETVLWMPGETIEYYSDGATWHGSKPKPFLFNTAFYASAPGWTTTGGASKMVLHPGRMAFVTISFTRSSTNATIPLANGVSTVTIGAFNGTPFLPTPRCILHSGNSYNDIVGTITSAGTLVLVAHQTAVTVTAGQFIEISGWITADS